MTDADVRKVSILGKDSIHCGFHLIPYIVHTVSSALPSSTICPHHRHQCLHALPAGILYRIETVLKNSKSRFLTHVIPPGETTKSREGKAGIEDFLLSQKCTRDTVILALGGVIGDPVGFVAATLFLPLCLLSMVDSSVGGKTAIDTSHGKNLIGAF